MGTLNYRDCIERLFVCEKDCLCLCKALKNFGVVGLAACLVRGMTYDENHKLERCIFLVKAIWGKRAV